MHVVIHSGITDEKWEGEVPIEPNRHPIFTNEELFRFFNRVDEDDTERLQALGYRLPSLSVGDTIVWNDRAWQVTDIGFMEVTA